MKKAEIIAKYKKWILTAFVIIIAFSAVFCCGCERKGSEEAKQSEAPMAVSTSEAPAPKAMPDDEEHEGAADDEEKAESSAKETDMNLRADSRENEESEPTEKPETEAIPTEKAENPEKPSCTVSIRCDTILKNMTSLNQAKHKLVPKDGVILDKTAVILQDGDSAFDVLLKVAQKHGIHIEFENTPFYGSAYIEGIANIYERDCGELSGWMCRINGVFPDVGASNCPVNDGDVIEWVYSCDFGKDV